MSFLKSLFGRKDARAGQGERDAGRPACDIVPEVAPPGKARKAAREAPDKRPLASEPWQALRREMSGTIFTPVRVCDGAGVRAAPPETTPFGHRLPPLVSLARSRDDGTEVISYYLGSESSGLASDVLDLLEGLSLEASRAVEWLPVVRFKRGSFVRFDSVDDCNDMAMSLPRVSLMVEPLTKSGRPAKFPVKVCVDEPSDFRRPREFGKAVPARPEMSVIGYVWTGQDGRPGKADLHVNMGHGERLRSYSASFRVVDGLLALTKAESFGDGGQLVWKP